MGAPLHVARTGAGSQGRGPPGGRLRAGRDSLRGFVRAETPSRRLVQCNSLSYSDPATNAIATLRSGLPTDLTGIVHSSLASNTDDRPATVIDFARRFSPCRRQVTPIQSQFDLQVTRNSDAGPLPVRHRATPRWLDHSASEAQPYPMAGRWVGAGLGRDGSGFLLRPRGDEPSRRPLHSGPVPFLVPPSNPPDAAAAVVPSASALPLASPPAAPEGAAMPSSKPATVTTNSSRNGRKSAAPHPSRQSRREPRHVSPYDPVFDPRNPYH